MEQKKQKLEKDRVRDLLNNWRRWSKDCPPDPAEVFYYTVSPMFRDFVKPSPGRSFPYDPDAAEMVEDVLREMFNAHKRERMILISYYQRDCGAKDLAEIMGVAKSTMYRQIEQASDVFSETWFLTHNKN
jgi:DNA-directed RNA polymerase specialized sigma24 family protein